MNVTEGTLFDITLTLWSSVQMTRQEANILNHLLFRLIAFSGHNFFLAPSKVEGFQPASLGTDKHRPSTQRQTCNQNIASYHPTFTNGPEVPVVTSPAVQKHVTTIFELKD